EAIRERLTDAGNPRNHNLTRLELACHAILSCAWIALRAEGYRPSRGDRHHQVTLESLADTLGAPAGDIDYFLDLARMRHATLYDAVVLAGTDIEAAIAAAADLSHKLEAWLKPRGPLPR
ncbi:MAG: hypothetical protein AB1778_06045, partial [Candidatus Bipolaricaulota bacterium]